MASLKGGALNVYNVTLAYLPHAVSITAKQADSAGLSLTTREFMCSTIDSATLNDVSIILTTNIVSLLVTPDAIILFKSDGSVQNVIAVWMNRQEGFLFLPNWVGFAIKFFTHKQRCTKTGQGEQLISMFHVYAKCK